MLLLLINVLLIRRKRKPNEIKKELLYAIKRVCGVREVGRN